MSIRPIVISTWLLTLIIAASWSAAQDTPATNTPVAVPPLSPGERVAESSRPGEGTLVSVSGDPLPDREQLPLGPTSDAQLPGAGTGTQLNATGAGSWAVQTAMALAVVIGLIVLMRFGLKRLGGQAGLGSGRGLVEVLARTPIGPKTHVVFLRVNQRLIVAGQTPAGINTLATLDDPEEIAGVLARIEAGRPASISRGFARLIGQLDQSYERTETETGMDSDEHVLDRARNQVSGLLGRIRNFRSDNPRQ